MCVTEGNSFVCVGPYIIVITSHQTHTTKNPNFTLTLPLPSLQNQTTNVVINILVVSS